MECRRFSTVRLTCSKLPQTIIRRSSRRHRATRSATCSPGRAASPAGCPVNRRKKGRRLLKSKPSWSTSWLSRRGIRERSWNWTRIWRLISGSTASARHNSSVRSARSMGSRLMTACRSMSSPRCVTCSATCCPAWAGSRHRRRPRRPSRLPCMGAVTRPTAMPAMDTSRTVTSRMVTLSERPQSLLHQSLRLLPTTAWQRNSKRS